jgi:uncharacterized protein (TIGR03086 family)
MDNFVEAFRQAQQAFTDRVHAVAEDQWQAPTPDTEWSVADLVGHLIEEHRWAAPLMHGLDLESARKVVEGSRSLPVDGGVGGNLAEEWDEAAVESLDAFSEPDAVNRTVALSRGPTPARDYLSEMIFDLVVHGWDLATAIGYSGDDLPDELVSAVYEQAKKFGDLSATGMFEKPVDVPEDARPIDKLVALTGRDPRRS